MRIDLKDIGKRYRNEWIFRHFNYTFSSGETYAILGSNGSGKSTLLQIIAGFVEQSEGTIKGNINSNSILPENYYQYVSIATPYLELIEELTLQELIDFHFQFKTLTPKINKLDVPEIIDLKSAINKPVKDFSSGMKQRLKLGLAFLSDTPLLLLDEPITNLDKAAINWYNNLLLKFTENRTVIICSNHIADEYQFCKNNIELNKTS